MYGGRFRGAKAANVAAPVQKPAVMMRSKPEASAKGDIEAEADVILHAPAICPALGRGAAAVWEEAAFRAAVRVHGEP